MRAVPPRPAPYDPVLECLLDRLPAAVLAAASARAAAIGVPPERVLIGQGLLSQDEFVRAYAARHGLAVAPLERLPRAAVPLDDAGLLDALARGALPYSEAGRPVHAMTPRAVDLARLRQQLTPELVGGVRLASDAALAAFVHRHAAGLAARRAAYRLARARPDMSAAPRRVGMRALFWLGLVTAAALLLAPYEPLAILHVPLTLMFLCWIVLRLTGAFMRPPHRPPLPRVRDANLPLYSIVVALHDEAACVPQLVAALRRFDYPPEKLDIKIVVEHGDAATRAALARAALDSRFEIVVALPEGPQTKPRALNLALPLLRGSFVAVYDAEDEPDPSQLRAVLAEFCRQDHRLACVQCALTIENAGANLLTRLFAADYAGLFDVLLPALSELRLPLPLGGSSNHFRVDYLRRAGGWDPYNVTEDADLGLRLARFGYRAAAIACATEEEAPIHLRAWIRQRTRWFKGWMQTWLVHMRRPRQLLADLGLAGFATFQLIVGGNVLAALAHPLMLAGVAITALRQGPLIDTDTPAQAAIGALYLATVTGGYGVSILLGCIGLERRGLAHHAWVLVLMPLHWLLLSAAAWRALLQLQTRPFYWEKTAHGLSRGKRAAPQK